MDNYADLFLQNVQKDAEEAGVTVGGGSRESGTSGGDIVMTMLTMRNQIKLYHWQTHLFSRHKATDELVEKLDGNIDTFVETYMGKYGRPTVTGSIKLHNYSEKASHRFVADCRGYFISLTRKLSKDDTDLLNLRDTILGDLNQALYLFTLH